MKNNLLFPFLISIFISSVSFSQTWVEMMNDPSVNFYDVQKEFNKSLKKYEYKLKKEKSVKHADREEMEMPGYMQYKRWEWFMEPRVYPSGDRSLLSKGMYDVREKLFSTSAMKSLPEVMQAGNWTLLGPSTSIPLGAGAGRIDCIAIDPANQNIMFVGSPAGGLWKSTDGGITWSTATDNLAVLAIADIAIDPANSNIIYVATGDGDGGDNYSVGVLKSTDGGATWNITGLSFPITQNAEMNRILINPNNSNIIYAGTSLGVFQSVDAGITWVKTLNASGIRDMEFKPGNPNIVYAASGSGFYRSVNGGTSFSTITSGLPTSGVGRFAIAVTPADTNYVYLLAGNSTNSGFRGVYRSVNGGSSFTTQSTTPNILGWSNDGSDVSAGGQAWYDLAFAASPSNKDDIVTGGVNIWRSTDGGVTWVINAHWTGSGAPYVHADIHALLYSDSTTVFSGNDGGFFKTSDNGTTWNDLSNGLQVAEMYRLGCSVTNSNLVIQGWQDNGTNRWSSGAWKQILGGDGMECFISWFNPNVMYGEMYNGQLTRSLNGGSSFSAITTGINEVGGWVTPWGIDPNAALTIYAGFLNVWKSTNQGTSWTKISSISAGQLQSLAVAPSNSNYIYAASSNKIYKTIDGGVTWTNITTGLPSQAITYIAVNGKDPNRVWVSLSGYYGLDKVYKTINGGSSWTNITYDLPNIPANCVVADTSSSKEGIYVGTDLGVYYLDTTRTNWLPFNNGFPNVTVDELEIQYSSKKLRAATYGMGLWETKLFNAASTSPAANFKGNTLTGCPGLAVQFTDMSTNNPTTWNWTFPNGNPSSSTQQNPLVTYNTAGTYNDVKLVATNAGGSDSITKYSYIGISNAGVPITIPAGTYTVCGSSAVINASFGASYKWLPNGQTNNFLNATSSGIYSVVVTDMFGCKDTSAAVNVTIDNLAVPVVSSSGDTLICSTAFSYQWYNSNSTIIAGATSQTYLGTPGNSYYVIITDANGCTKTSAVATTAVNESILPGVSMNITPSPNSGNFSLFISLADEKNLSVEIVDIAGKIIYSRELGAVSGKVKEDFSLKLSKGMYFLTLKSKTGRAMKKFAVE